MSQIQIPPPSINIAPETISQQISFAVEMKTLWTGPWIRQNYIQPLNSMDAVAPSVGRASFIFKYGVNKREDSTQFAQEFDIEALEQYIRVIKLDSQSSLPLWTGVVQFERLAPFGGNNPAGDERFEALGLCQFLDREKIRKTKCACADGTNSYVDEVPKANVRYKKGVQTFGNRSNQTDSDGAYVFSTDGAQWSNLDLVNMILARHTPAGGPTFVLGGQTSVLDTIHGVYELYDKTPWECLNELISRNRGLGFAPIVSDQFVTLYVYSILEDDFASGNIQVPANDNPVNIDMDSSIDVLESDLVYSAATKFERIEVHGAPILSCFTLSYADGTLEKAWSSAAETAYKAAGGQTDLSLIDEFRKDHIFEAVYAKHRIPRTFTGMVGDGTGGPQVNVFPVSGDDGTIELDESEPPPFFSLGKYFENFLPFQEGGDYTTDPPTFTFQPTGAEPVYIRPFAMVRQPPAADGTLPQRWMLCHNPGENFPGCGAHLRNYPREMAIGLEASPKHAYALGTFTLAPAPASALEGPVVDYRQLIVTVAMRTSQRLKAVAAAPDWEPGDPLRTKVIDLTKLNRKERQDDEYCGAEFWYCNPGTIIGIDSNGAFKRYKGDGVLRDDSDKLQEICAFAAIWYCKTRAAITFRQKTIDPVRLGSLIIAATTGGVRRSVGTPVTSIGYDFTSSPSQLIQTTWSELDFR